MDTVVGPIHPKLTKDDRMHLRQQGREMGMFMVMPMEGTGIEALSELEGRLTPESVRSLMENLKPRTISLQLPRFRIHKRLNLKVDTTCRISKKEHGSPVTQPT